ELDRAVGPPAQVRAERLAVLALVERLAEQHLLEHREVVGNDSLSRRRRRQDLLVLGAVLSVAELAGAMKRSSSISALVKVLRNLVTNCPSFRWPVRILSCLRSSAGASRTR